MDWTEIAIIGGALVFSLAYIAYSIVSYIKEENSCGCGRKKCKK